MPLCPPFPCSAPVCSVPTCYVSRFSNSIRRVQGVVSPSAFRARVKKCTPEDFPAAPPLTPQLLVCASHCALPQYTPPRISPQGARPQGLRFPPTPLGHNVCLPTPPGLPQLARPALKFLVPRPRTFRSPPKKRAHSIVRVHPLSTQTVPFTTHLPAHPNPPQQEPREHRRRETREGGGEADQSVRADWPRQAPDR